MKKLPNSTAAKQRPTPLGVRVTRFVRRQRSWLVAAAVIAALAGGVLYLSRPSTSTAVDAAGNTVKTGVIRTDGAAAREGRPAPDFLLADYDGKAVKLDDFRGKTVLLNFWASWCTTCEAEMPDMDRLAREHPDDLVVLGVNQKEGKGTAKQFSDGLGLKYFHFALDRNEDVTNAYHLPSGLPHSFFIDKDGIVRIIVHGGMTYNQMRSRLEETVKAADSGPVTN